MSEQKLKLLKNVKIIIKKLRKYFNVNLTPIILKV